MDSKSLRMCSLLSLLLSAVLASSNLNAPVAGIQHSDSANAHYPRPAIGLDPVFISNDPANDNLVAAAIRLSSNSTDPTTILEMIKTIIAPYVASTQPSQVKEVQDRAFAASDTVHADDISTASSSEPSSLLECCISGACPSTVCRSLFVSPATQLPDLYSCCLTNPACPAELCSAMPEQAVTSSGSSRDAVPRHRQAIVSDPSAASNASVVNTTSSTSCCNSHTCVNRCICGDCIPPRLDLIQKAVQQLVPTLPLTTPPLPGGKSEL